MEGIERAGQGQSEHITAQEKLIAGDDPVGYRARTTQMLKGDDRGAATAAGKMFQKRREILRLDKRIRIQANQDRISAERGKARQGQVQADTAGQADTTTLGRHLKPRRGSIDPG